MVFSVLCTFTFQFTLFDVSHEKGYCINSPVTIPESGEDWDTWKDLQFKDNQTNYTISGTDNDVAESTFDDRNTATVRVSSYDYGAYGKIKVEFTKQDSDFSCVEIEVDGSNEFTTIPLDTDGNFVRDGSVQNEGPNGKIAAADDLDAFPFIKKIQPANSKITGITGTHQAKNNITQ